MRYQWLAFLILFMVFETLKASVVVSLNHSKIAINEGIILTINLKDGPDNALPNLAPLEQDFIITSTEQSKNYQIINDKVDFTAQWQIKLNPKKAGRLIIPELAVGHDHTLPLVLEVTSTSSLSNTSVAPNVDTKDARITTSIEPQPGYINQQLIYTVKIYLTQKVMDVSYQPPTVKDALLIALGNSKRYQTLDDNQRIYTVEEQKYAIFPQKSGQITVNPPIINALIYDNVAKKEIVTGKKMAINIEAVPDNFKGQWLAAKQVWLKEKPLDKKITTNQVLTRIIYLKALGTIGQLLPKIKVEKSPLWQAYSEKPQLSNELFEQNILSHAVIKINYAFNQPGQVTLPEINLPWFNTQTKQTEQAHLPAQTFTVVALAKNDKAETRKLINSKIVASKNDSWMPTLLVIIKLMASAIGLYLVIPKKAVKRRKRPTLKTLKEACLTNNPKAAQKALLEWSHEKWPECLTIEALAGRLDDPDLKQALYQLAEALYNPKISVWQGQKLWQVLAKFKVNTPKSAIKKNQLPNLYEP